MLSRLFLSVLFSFAPCSRRKMQSFSERMMCIYIALNVLCDFTVQHHTPALLLCWYMINFSAACLQLYRWNRALPPSSQPLFLKEWRLLTSLGRLKPIKYVRYHLLITITTFSMNSSEQAMAMDVKLTQIHQDEFSIFYFFPALINTGLSVNWVTFHTHSLWDEYCWDSTHESSMFVYVAANGCIFMSTWACVFALVCWVSWGQSGWMWLPQREAVALEAWHFVTPHSVSPISDLFHVAAYIKAAMRKTFTTQKGGLRK